VYGSYPYHGNSSICLAAIHSGIISDEDGGWLQYGHFGAYHQPEVADLRNAQADAGRLTARVRFPPHAVISGYELFPFNSSQPSLSNGVQSLPTTVAVCGSCTTLPNTTLQDASFVVWAAAHECPRPACRPGRLAQATSSSAPTCTPRYSCSSAAATPLTIWYGQQQRTQPRCSS
jgi:hypothetical protein